MFQLKQKFYQIQRTARFRSSRRSKWSPIHIYLSSFGEERKKSFCGTFDSRLHSSRDCGIYGPWAIIFCPVRASDFRLRCARRDKPQSHGAGLKVRTYVASASISAADNFFSKAGIALGPV